MLVKGRFDAMSRIPHCANRLEPGVIWIRVSQNTGVNCPGHALNSEGMFSPQMTTGKMLYRVKSDVWFLHTHRAPLGSHLSTTRCHLSHSSLSVLNQSPPNCFVKATHLSRLLQWVREKIPSCPRDFFFLNKLSKDKTSALLCGLVNYFQFGILIWRPRHLPTSVAVKA